jgi:hydrogenase/urease accessory protein HupE
MEGFLSGLGASRHCLDNLAFVVALVCWRRSAPGVSRSCGLVLAAMVGTALHLAEITLPLAELIIGVRCWALVY